jgi:Tol biopolymer transport system component
MARLQNNFRPLAGLRASGAAWVPALALTALALAACGGGGDSGATNNANPAATNAVTGAFFGPVGAHVTLRLNGANDQSVTVPAFGTSGDPYNAQNFAFVTALTDGSAYEVSLADPPAGQTCAVFKSASGTLPVALGTLRVGCEITDDLVSINSNSEPATVIGSFFDSSAPVVGGADVAVGSTTQGLGEGRFVAFVSSAGGLAPGATSAHRQVYWRDRFNGITLLVSASAAGVEGNGDSFAPAISADGVTVAFESHATNLVANDNNGVRDVFLWSAQTQEALPGVTRVSVGPAGLEADAESFEPTLSGDGARVAFSSAASNLTTGVVGTSTVNVVLRQVASGSNTLVSADAAGIGRGGSSPMLSESGTRLVFWSFSDQLVAGDANGLWDIFVHDSGSGAGTLTRVSLATAGGERNQGNDAASRIVAPAISGDGRFVAYASTATNLVAGDSNAAQDVFVVDTQTGAVTRASVSSTGAEGDADSPIGAGERPALSYDGSWVAFSSQASNLGAPPGNVLMHHRITGETRVVSNQSTSSVGAPALSRNAGYVVFGTGVSLDSRFASSGLFAHFTQLVPSFWWLQ